MMASRKMCRFLPGVLLGVLTVLPVQAGELQVLDHARLVEHPVNDGDSFMVEAGGQTYHFRLYFVDAPELHINTEYDARRAREQAYFFGIRDIPEIIRYGEEARRFTRSVLDKPFTVYTAFARSPGGRHSHRYYAFIRTSGGEDLAELLVRNGLARSYGVDRETPEGVHSEDMSSLLDRYEDEALARGVGVWSETDPAQLKAMRAEMAREENELRELHAYSDHREKSLYDINSATAEQLSAVPGIGGVLASRILAHRPYDDLGDLRDIPGIGPVTYQRITHYLTIR